MELYVLDSNFTVLGTIDNYECLVWERHYYKPAPFTMQIIPSFRQFELLKKGNILLKKDDTKEAVFIDHRELTENDEGVEILVVTGFSLSQWTDKRITLYKEAEKGNAETIMRNYVSRHCISPSEANRRIPHLIHGINQGLGSTMDYMSHYKPLIEELNKIAKANEIGYRIDLDLEKKQYVFEVYKGLDRTINQTINNQAKFSREFENISNQNYVDSDSNFKNMVLIAGAGEDLNRKTLTVGTSNVGLNRNELFVDARDIADTIQPDGEGDEVPIPLDEYNKLLETRANEALAEAERIETFDCTLENIKSLQYRKDFDLGDKVSIINNKWGLIQHERIISVEETYDQEGLKIQIKIGNNIPTIIDKIKQNMR